ncbi:MAG: hypothetical protein IJS83_03595 [Acholeplasmatales bacterium]|nr:hypothetical protein [Acholeplasmatales bacterium]
MKKKRLFLLALASATFVLAGCGAGNAALPGTTTGTTPNTTTNSGTDTETTQEQEKKVMCYICTGTKKNKKVIDKQQVIKGKKLLEQLTYQKDGYRILNYRLDSSTTGDIISDDYVIDTDMNIFIEMEMIDYNSIHEINEEKTDLKDYAYMSSLSEAKQANFYQNGFVKDKIIDFSTYQNSPAYVQVSTADELIAAINNAKSEYETNWTYDTLTQEQQNKVTDYEGLMEKRAQYGDAGLTSEEKTRRITLENEIMTYTGSFTQNLIKEQSVHVIEITSDLNLGYNKLSSASKALVTNWASTNKVFSATSHFTENGVSQININNSYNLLIYSKNGAKITNAGFKISSCNGVVVRNIEMDEMWQWEDCPNATPQFTVGDMDVFGWAYFKVNFSTNVWIDHCTFGKSYDGQIDVANPYWYNNRTYSSAPYGVDGRSQKSNVHISNCYFKAGSDDKDGYIYKMMEEIEADYQKSKSDSSYSCKYLYYKTLRDTYDLTFEEILYGVAIPQKKAFLLGDSGESKKAESYRYNQNLCVSFSDNVIVDIEDRLPNVRGGIAYMANCVIDNSRYFKYRNILMAKGANGINSVNSKYKLALVSQGIIGGYGASIEAENCLFIGVNSLVKNNNKEKDNITDAQMEAGYEIVNCKWYNDPESTDYTRIINTVTDPSQIQTNVDNVSSSPMKVSNFNWHNDTNEKPFDIKLYEIDTLSNSLLEKGKVGVNTNFGNYYLYTKAEYYTIK